MENNIYKKIFDLQSEIGVISKDAKNPFFKSKYFDINSLIKQLHPLLIKNKLVLLQPIVNGSVKTIIAGLDGSSVESSLELPTNLDAQKIGSAITYYRRYTLASLLGLQAVDDDGNNTASVASKLTPPKPLPTTTKDKVLSKEEVMKLLPDMQKHIRSGNTIEEKVKRFNDLKLKYAVQLTAVAVAKLEAASK
tara:strand:+ start:1679 stop:2257 length:579 start_codon:yes stop_codon:yes gene_type:complete